MATFSIEKLYHFRCWSCRKWWTVSDVFFDPENEVLVTCPMCNERQEFKQVPEDGYSGFQ